jgi:hypothetical protein
MEVGIVSLEKLRELRRSIAPLGWEDGFPADEFDSQLMGLVGRLRGGATDLEAQAYLTRIDEELMGPAEAAEASEVHAQLVKSVRNYLEQFPPGRLKFR